MEERLKTYLRPGEQVRWQGRPAPFSLLEAEAKKQILLKWGLTVALGGGLLAVYLSGTEAPSMGFIGLVLLVAAVILISPVAERRNLMGEQYWITNQRAILMTRDKTFFYMELSDIDDLQVVGGTTKGKSLVLGRCLFEEAKKLLRWRACHPKVDVQSHDETDRALGMIFYGVQGAEAAAELLRQTNRTVLDIAGQFGYDNASKFAKAFRDVIGVSPREYRSGTEYDSCAPRLHNADAD